MSNVEPRIVFQRPRFSRGGARVAMALLVGILLWCALSSADVETKVIIGTFTLLAAPFVLLVWFRVAQRIELDASGITVAGRLGSTHYSWHEVAANRVRYPTHNWNDDEVETPAVLADVEPAFTLSPPTSLTGTPLQVATYGRLVGGPRDAWIFWLREGLTYLRSQDPDGDWPTQAATIFAARDAGGFGPGRKGVIPTATARDVR